MTTLYVVPAERHVERLARAGERAETRSSLRARLAAALLPDVRFADPRAARLTLGVAIEEARGTQLDLFAAGAAPDPLLAELRGPSWVRAVAAIDDAIGALRARGVGEAQLDRAARGAGVAAARARTLVAAMRALDRGLAPARDGRLLGFDLAAAIRAAGRSTVAEAIGASSLRARWLLAWDPHDLAWWRALDDVLGDARVVLPWFDKKLEGARERDPLEVIADVVLKHLEAAPETEVIPAVLGDLASVPPASAETVRVGKAADASEQARLVARAVAEALDGGARVERVVIAYPVRDERTLRPLRRELGARGIVFHDALGPPPSAVPVVAAALAALAAAESKDRVAVARVLRSGYVDAPRALGDEELSFREAERVLDRIARALETHATAPGATASERLIATAGGDDAARRIVSLFEQVSLFERDAKTRIERVRAARRLFHELGIAARAGRGALGTFARDEAPSGVDRAERLAVARDVRAWEVLEDALDAYETAAASSARPIDAEVFLLELGELLDASAQLPGAGRAAAVRVTRLADVAGDELDLLVVLDANDGVLPRDARPLSLVTESLEERVKMRRDAGEHAARDLAALATCVAEARSVLLVTTAEDGSDAPATPARVVVAALRAGAAAIAADLPPPAARIADVARRAERERRREGFFLDPRRPESDVVGALSASDAIAGVVGPETGLLRERPLAVTSIERFAQCAFKGYAHAVLAAREGEEQQELPDAREEGNLGHAALAAAFLATRVEWPLRPRDPARVLAKGLAAAEDALALAAGHAPLRAIVRLRIRESVRAVLTRALEEETWDFALAEQTFGSTRSRGAQEAWPPFDAGGVLWLRGSVDRVDRQHDGARVRVIDYKRSKSTAQASMTSLGEAAIQVPLYAAIGARNLGLPATGLYLPTQPRDLATTPATPRVKDDRVAELAAARPAAPSALSAIEERVVSLAVAARRGRFTPIPIRESECTHCSMSGGCRKPRFAMSPEDELLDDGAPA
ncbi:MAG: PD-(D/E)XK nuclease family protein [Labilithrix sp.]|nr:PD-(D/E)XK nuclease family protein [Labilithrix sp.]